MYIYIYIKPSDDQDDRPRLVSLAKDYCSFDHDRDGKEGSHDMCAVLPCSPHGAMIRSVWGWPSRVQIQRGKLENLSRTRFVEILLAKIPTESLESPNELLDESIALLNIPIFMQRGN